MACKPRTTSVGATTPGGQPGVVAHAYTKARVETERIRKRAATEHRGDLRRMTLAEAAVWYRSHALPDQRTGEHAGPHPVHPRRLLQEEPRLMTILTPAIASPDMLFLSERRATRYATDMRKEHADPHYTVARYTTAQAAEMLGISRVTVQAAIRRGRLESELASPNVRLISQAAIDAYRAHHLGQVGQPTRKKQKMMQKMVEARKAAAGVTSPSDVSAGDTGTPDANDETEE